MGDRSDAILLGRAINGGWLGKRWDTSVTVETLQEIAKTRRLTAKELAMLHTIEHMQSKDRRLSARGVANLTRMEAQNQSDQHHDDGRQVHHDHVITVDARRTRLLGIAQRLGLGELSGIDAGDGAGRVDGSVAEPTGESDHG